MVDLHTRNEIAIREKGIFSLTFWIQRKIKRTLACHHPIIPLKNHLNISGSSLFLANPLTRTHTHKLLPIPSFLFFYEGRTWLQLKKSKKEESSSRWMEEQKRIPTPVS
ncbi:hypothetical protein AVEN_184036-1 [Araneus ventricosus]|uniref:Uncharacterized protein n=1 Tax=Araneus ventricosus TaxID=182803 RepID=A0A4Y2S8K7_ARAVE|nr:hypothetical protein AVEN_166386-1 [Araneus ventricosus]GBN84554.1 hypothetical protein AVEN_184036-1 [Araneus ventricosus]